MTTADRFLYLAPWVDLGGSDKAAIDLHVWRQWLYAEIDALRGEIDSLRRAHAPRVRQTDAVARPHTVVSRLRQIAGRIAEQSRAMPAAPSARVADPGAPARPADEAEPDMPPVRFPPGHYYSAMYDAHELVREPARSRIWPPRPYEHPGIDWNADGQRSFMRDVLAGQQRLALRADGDPEDSVYYAANGQYPPLDAWILEGVLRHLRPARMIEVGSGFSSLITAQVNREHFDGEMQFTCIEPHPRGFLQRGVDGITELVAEKVEDVELARFEALEAGDVLFIDTSHVVRTGGDVVWLYGRVLPRLRLGVHVHIHDVFLPGDYPEQWVREGWGWNENYLVEAFLQFNSGYEIVLAAQWARLNAREEIDIAFPRYAQIAEQGGGALWLRRT